MARKALEVLVNAGELSLNQAAHWAINLGHEELADSLYTKLDPKEDEEVKTMRAIEFRRSRKKRVKNCYQEIVNLTEAEKREVINKAIRSGIELNGGIGDHLEEASRITSFAKKNSLTLSIFSTKQRMNQLQDITKDFNWKTNNTGMMASKLFLAALGNNIGVPEKFINNVQSERINRNSILTCFTAVGNGDILSQWARSIDFRNAEDFFGESILKKVNITDISYWKSWEAKKLKKLGIERYEPNNGTVKDLAEIAMRHSHVITIDSALAHLCAAMGKKCTVLIPKYHDERWYELLKGGSSYEQYCDIVKQELYGDWKIEVEEVKGLFEKIKGD
ncbi:hypothetical protein ETE01_01200 [Synechococcus sp. HB1133]|nr:glycosyltransferase family 61 protein [Synechococcus sp. HBA1120]NHI80397.1 hypothetical protein [Synechococcus sp. HB1133]